MTRLHPIFSRLLALLLVFVVIAVAWLAAVQPLARQYTTLNERQAELETLRDRYLGAAALRGAREAELAALRESELQIDGLIDAPNLALAAAEMQTVLAEAITDAGGVVRRVTVLPGEPGGAFEKIGLQLLFTTDTPGLRMLLMGLEIDQRAYRVGGMQINGFSGTRPSDDADLKDQLTVQMEVYGFRRASASEG